MSEKQKEIASKLTEAITKLPESEAMYLLGRAEAQAEMASAKEDSKNDGKH